MTTPSPFRRFEFHYDRVTVSIVSADARFDSAMRRLQEDFENFPTGVSPGGVEIAVDLTVDRAVGDGGRGKTPLTPRYRFYPRRCDHGGGTTSFIERRGRSTHVEIDGRDVDHVYEITYVAILSLLGWELEKLGFVRLHALAIAFDSRVSLFHLPPKGGKSTLALECIRERREVLGDEIALVKGGEVFAFPIRLAVSPAVAPADSSRVFARKYFDDKALVRLPRPTRMQAPLGSILFQSKPGLATSSSRAGLLDGLEWLTWVCSGRGLPQMREFALRFEECGWIPLIAMRRFVFAFRHLVTGELRISREISLVNSSNVTELRSRSAWARSSSGTSVVGSEESHEERRADTSSAT